MLLLAELVAAWGFNHHGDVYGYGKCAQEWPVPGKNGGEGHNNDDKFHVPGAALVNALHSCVTSLVVLEWFHRQAESAERSRERVGSPYQFREEQRWYDDSVFFFDCLWIWKPQSLRAKEATSSWDRSLIENDNKEEDRVSRGDSQKDWERLLTRLCSQKLLTTVLLLIALSILAGADTVC